jgi:hypothetical protein
MVYEIWRRENEKGREAAQRLVGMEEEEKKEGRFNDLPGLSYANLSCCTLDEVTDACWSKLSCAGVEMDCTESW